MRPCRAGCAMVCIVLAALVSRARDAEDFADERFLDEATRPQPVAAVSASGAGEWVVAPIPTLSPSQGWGVNVIGQFIYKSAGQSAATPSSVVGVLGFYTENKSWGVLGGYLGHWRDDRWRPAFAGGKVEIHYDFFGVGNDQAELDLSIPIEQRSTLAGGQLLRRVGRNVYAGLRVGIAEIQTITPPIELPPLVVPPFAETARTTVVGPLLQYDTRDDQFYPTRGAEATVSAMFFEGDTIYQYYTGSWNSYHAVSTRGVLAWRLTAQGTAGDPPFYALPQFGRNSDLRGYKSGKYRDRNLVATQVEYRHRFGARWGAVVFAGVGEVAAALNEMNTDNLLGSAGLGVRFRIAKKNKVNFRVDWAYGKDGSATYVAVGEAF